MATFAPSRYTMTNGDNRMDDGIDTSDTDQAKRTRENAQVSDMVGR
jgi:hypothetical protein